MRGIVAEVGYLNLPRLDPSRLKRQYSYLKKPVSLPRCSPEGLAALKNCLGHKISNVAGGYVLTLCAVPSSLTNPDLRLKNPRLYGTLAAELLSEPFKHPVSGGLVTCGFSHPNVKATLTSRALAYLKHIRDSRLRLVCQLVRFEGEDVPFEFDPREFFDLPALQRLFQDRALLVRSQDREDGRGLLSTLRGVVCHLAGILGESFRDCEGVGRYDPSWKAFQAELALEELFFGHPLSSLNTLSASLGASTVSERSATHERGFIGLAPHNSASLEESPPPLNHWTRDPLQETRIERLWALCQCVEAGPALLGAALIRVLLGDLYKRNDQLPCTSLKLDTTPGRLTGTTDVKKLAADLATKESFPVPHTFGRARTLVRDAGQDVEDCLVQGFTAEGIVFFLA
ncbi:unnamed protein product [Arctogadus glacialis]